MPELELTRTPGDRKLYELTGVGRLRLRGWAGRAATAETSAGDRSWEIARRGLFKALVEATDATGTPVGSYEPRTFRRGGTVTWQGDGGAGARGEYLLRPASAWKERYALASTTAPDHELALIEGKGWGKRPVLVDVPTLATLPPGLLLFTVYVVRTLAEDTGAAGGGAVAAGVAATSG
jgi:hypothetical protein